MQKGKFIVFEGIDGSGKSTQIKELYNHLTAQGIPCYMTKEPSDGPFGAMVHQCMTGRIESDDKAFACLFAADRLDHLLNSKNGLVEKINNGITVISDRYYFSSYAYHSAYDMPLDWVIEVNKLSAQTLRPDLNIFIDVDPEESMKRVSCRGELERYEKTESLKKIREQYFKSFERLKDEENVAVLSGAQSISDIAKQVADLVDGLYKK